MAGKNRGFKAKPTRSSRAAQLSVPGTHDDDQPEQLEGDESPEGIENYPLDDLLIRSEARTIQDVLRRIDANKIDLDPEFQRAFLWKVKEQSKLVESVLMRIPLPVFYVAENDNGDLVVVDGRQRLTTFRRFQRNELKLDLAGREQLNGKTFENLDSKLQIRFEDGQLIFYIIGAKVPERVRLDIFERVNGGTPLTRQQMRHALYSGEATRLLTSLAAMELFKKVTGSSVSSDTNVRAMKDREVVNRFLAYYQLGWRQYAGAAYDDFLARALRETNDVVREQKVIMDRSKSREKAKNAFMSSLRLNQAIFAEHAFRKSLTISKGKRSAFNLALFDVFSATLARYDEQSLSGAQMKAIYAGTKKLLGNRKFRDAVSFATLEARNVQIRFEMTEGMLFEVLGAPNP